MLAPATAFSQGIAGSAHDFSDAGWSGGKLCAVCHTPHNAEVSVTDAPLWNHEMTTATYTPYTSATLTATDVGDPSNLSKLCLSCHDGTVAVDSFGGAGGGTLIGAINPAADLGTDLSNDHPVSFTYDHALSVADPGLFDPDAKVTALGGTITADLLFNGEMECTSCHDVHNKAGLPSLLRISNAGSQLCLTCHNM